MSFIINMACGRYFIVDTGASGLVISGKKVRNSFALVEWVQVLVFLTRQYANKEKIEVSS